MSVDDELSKLLGPLEIIVGTAFENISDELDDMVASMKDIQITSSFSLAIDFTIILANICCFFLVAIYCNSIIRLTLLMKAALSAATGILHVFNIGMELGIIKLPRRTRDYQFYEFFDLLIITWHKSVSFLFLHEVHR